MSYVDRVAVFLEGGKRGCLWDIVAGAVCGDCKPEDDACDTCQGIKIISEVENQIAKNGLDYMKNLAHEWVKGSVT